MPTAKNSKKLFSEAVDEALQFLGESGKTAVYFYLERNWSIRKEDIAKNPEAFFKGLRKMFGPGSEVLEQVIRRKLKSKLEKFHEEKGRRVSRNKSVRDNPRLTHGSGLVRTSLLPLIAAAHNSSV